MLKYIPFLLLAVAFGCSTGDPVSETPVGGETASNSETVELTLPPATATVVRFTMPGMT